MSITAVSLSRSSPGKAQPAAPPTPPRNGRTLPCRGSHPAERMRWRILHTTGCRGDRNDHADRGRRASPRQTPPPPPRRGAQQRAMSSAASSTWERSSRYRTTAGCPSSFLTGGRHTGLPTPPSPPTGFRSTCTRMRPTRTSTTRSRTVSRCPRGSLHLPALCRPRPAPCPEIVNPERVRPAAGLGEGRAADSRPQGTSRQSPERPSLLIS